MTRLPDAELAELERLAEATDAAYAVYCDAVESDTERHNQSAQWKAYYERWCEFKVLFDELEVYDVTGIVRELSSSRTAVAQLTQRVAELEAESEVWKSHYDTCPVRITG